MNVDQLARTFDPEGEDSRFDENGWLRPEVMGQSNLDASAARIWYRERYRVGRDRQQDVVSYANHYRGATRTRPNRISVERMQWLADKIALERIRGNWK